MDSARLRAQREAGTFFLIRAKRALSVKRRHSRRGARINMRMMFDQTVTPEIFYSKQGYPTALGRVVSRDNDG